MSREAKEKHPKPTDDSQLFKWRCGKCGERGRATLRHYDKVDCSRCGMVFWALRPKRNEPMKLYVHASCRPKES